MRIRLFHGVLLGLIFSTPSVVPASAQVIPNLSGSYHCVQNCAGTAPAFVTQSGWDLNLTNEAGQPSRAWVDWPGHIWAEYWHQGAVYSEDGMTIQFDNGSVWQRIVPPPYLRSRG